MKTKYLLLCAVLFLVGHSVFAQSRQPIGSEISYIEDAKRFLYAKEKELEPITDQSARHHILIYLAPAALAANETKKAETFAQELLDTGEKLKSAPGFGSSFYGRSVYIANIVFGHIALNANDIGKAKEHLLAAARIPGSPELNSFGPNMKLAKQLIEKGERQTVIEYFDLCAKFWKSQNGRLERWKAAVERGETPDFGFNLRTMDTWRAVQ